MVPVSAFLSRLLPHVLGCPEPLAQQALVDAAISFCDQTLVIQNELEPVDVVAGTNLYELDLPSHTRVAQIMRVRFGERWLGAAPAQGRRELEGMTGMPAYFFTQVVDELLTLQLYPKPDKDLPAGLAVRVALSPTRTATQFPSVLFDEWADVIVDMARAAIHDTPGQSFTSEAKAVVLQQKTRHRVSVARIESMRGRVASSLSVSQRGF